MEFKNSFELLYNNKKIIDVEYNSTTTIDLVIKWISEKFKINYKNIKLFYNKKCLNNIQSNLVSSILITQLCQIPNSKTKVQVIPQISLDNVYFKTRFVQIGNEINTFEINADLFSKFSSVKIEVFNFFQKIFTEFNQKLNSANYLISQDNEIPNDSLNDDKFLFENFPYLDEKTFSFLIKHQSICFYSQNSNELKEDSKKIEKLPDVGMFKLPKKDESFKIIIQTYNKIIKEIEVYNMMTIDELKDRIQQIFYVSKNYQELIFLFYKLDDDTLKISDYKMKKNSTVYLRGFYFPLIFCDFYTKQKSHIYINIASLISEIIQIIISKFKLDCDINSIQLICNGKILDCEKYLIEYNIQKYQTIYFK